MLNPVKSLDIYYPGFFSARKQIIRHSSFSFNIITEENLSGRMNHYIIDGNNLIGRIPSLQKIHKKDKHTSREQLVNILNRYFAGKKLKLTLHLDGHPNFPLSVSKGKIEYSMNQPSDNLIRNEIEYSKNPRLIILITSDRSLMNFAKVCSCTVISSDEFYKSILKSSDNNDEESRIRQLGNEKGEFLKLFQERKK